jgi:nucleoside-diphosphate-sugar epimerase
MPLAQRWHAAGDTVYVTTRSSERAAIFEGSGFRTLVLDTTVESSLRGLQPIEFDTVVVAVGMDRSKYSNVHEVYVGGLRNVLDNLHENVGQLIYVSSTGVYGDFGGDWVDEASPTNPVRDGGKACLAAERLLQGSRFADRATVLRMAGLYGNDRVPTKKVVESRQWDKLSPKGFLNLIHVDDAVSAVCAVTDDDSFKKETFLVADSSPSLRQDYYQHLADLFELGPIPWGNSATDPNSRGAASKRISNRKLLEITGLVLKHPDFKSGLKDC